MTERPKVYIDTNVFIAAFESTGPHHDDAWSLFSAIEEGRLIGVTSELTLAELLVKPFEEEAVELAQAYQTMLTSSEWLMVCAIDRSLLVDAARLRSARLRLKLPDAVHVATAHRFGCNMIVSDDRGVSSGAAISRIPLGPECLEHVLRDAP